MRLSHLGLSPAALACLRRAGIRNLDQLLGHTCRELIWHSQIGPGELHETICRLGRHGLMLRPTPARRSHLPGERDREMFRLRIVEGLTLEEIGQRLGVGKERVRQVLSFYFGLKGTPPAAKARNAARRQR